MTPDEQRMIQDLFQRLGAQGRVAKDAQAERLIADGLRANPDAGYLLVQTALVYEHQMTEQEARIRELEDQIAALQSSAAQAPAGGSFLGGALGGRIGGRGSVPNAGPAQAASPWQTSAAQPQAYQQQVPQQRTGIFGGGAPAAPQAAPGGGFFRSALQTAAGVAGGMVIANSLGSLFGGGHEAHASTPAASSDNGAAWSDADATQDELQDATFDSGDTGGDAGGSWDGGIDT